MLTGIVGTDPIFLIPPSTATDSVGDTVTNWAAPTRTRLARASAELRESSDDGGARSTVDDRALLIVIGNPGLTAVDRIEWRGAVWAIDGDPLVRRSLATGPHTEAFLRRREVRT